MGGTDTLSGLGAATLDVMMRHPEQLANLTAVVDLLHRLDEAGSDPASLLDAQAHLFRASYRAQQAAGDIRRARKRLRGGKDTGWPVDRDAGCSSSPSRRGGCAATLPRALTRTG